MQSRSRSILSRSVVQLIAALWLCVSLAPLQAADPRQPADLPEKQSEALAFVKAEEAALPDNVVKVTISRFSYQPAEITVEPGTTILWVNEDPAGHNASFVAENLPDLEQDLAGPIVGQGERFAVQFEKAGRYDYYCTPHPFMKGAVVVE